MSWPIPLREKKGIREEKKKKEHLFVKRKYVSQGIQHALGTFFKENNAFPLDSASWNQ